MAQFSTDSKLLVSFYGRCFGQRIILTHHYDLNLIGGPIEVIYNDAMEQVIDQVESAGGSDIVTALRDCLPAQWRLEEIRAQVIWPLRYVIVSRAYDLPGVNAAAATVANDSAALTFRTERAGRRFVGTKHLGPVPDGASAAGLLTANYITTVNALGTVMMNPVVTTDGPLDWRPCIYNRDQPIGSPRIESFIVGRQSRVQRRRTVGLGE